MVVGHESCESVKPRRIACAVEKLIRRKRDYPGLYETEFIGINISDSSSQTESAIDEIKLYVYGGNADNELVKDLRGFGMVGCTETVLSGQAGLCSRINIGLNNRDSKHMLRLREYIMQNFNYMVGHAKEFDYLLRMPISSKPGYELASLYYLGLSSPGNDGESLKCYFITRELNNNVEDIRRDYSFDNERYLDYIARLGAFEFLIGPAELLLSYKDVDLWMVGIDYSLTASPRRKLYFCCIKKPFPLELLSKALHESGLERLSAKLDTLIDELSESICLSNLMGFAISAPQPGMGLNLYFGTR